MVHEHRREEALEEWRRREGSVVYRCPLLRCTGAIVPAVEVTSRKKARIVETNQRVSARETAFQRAHERGLVLRLADPDGRAATCVAQRWHPKDRAAEGVSLLEEAYRHFPEHFDIQDLARARVLLERPSGS